MAEEGRRPEENEPMDEDDDDDDAESGEDGSEEEDNPNNSDEDEEEDESSDDELPNLDFIDGDGGGGELMRVPVHVDIEQLERQQNVGDIEMEDAAVDYGITDRWHEFSDASLQKFLQNLCHYLSFEDLKLLRLASPRFNSMLIDQLLHKCCKQTYSTKFYKVGVQWNSQISLRPGLVTFQNFLFHRRHDFFKKHWQLTATYLETLELKNCSFECEGLKFLVDFAPFLTKLTISNCKLRDVDNFHENPRKTPVTKVEVPKIYLGIRILHLEGIKVIENCFMHYLIEKIKPNTLTELSLSNCFIDDIQTSVVPTAGTTLAVEYFRYFLPLFHQLIMKNALSLKKMAFNGNAFQMLMLQKLTENCAVMKQLEPTQLSLTLLKPVAGEVNWNNLLQFLRERCLKLEKLNLQIVDHGNVQNVRNILETLTLMNSPLKTFNFEFTGNSKEDKIELGGLLKNLKELKHLLISDTKALDPDVKYIVGGGRFWRYRLHSCFGFTPAHSDRLVRDSLTNIQSTVLTELPQNLNSLCVKRLLPEKNIWLECFQNPACLESFKNLTKLEICGPYIHCMHLVVPHIFTLANLETLALPNCDIQDTYITGLNWEAIMDLRRCLTPCFAAIGLKASKADLDKALLDATKKSANNEVLTATRPKLSNLSKLKSLDLSNNPQISDVGIYDSALPLVQNLVLQNCSKVTDNGLWMIGSNFPSLSVLNVKHCRKMSKYGLSELIKKCNSIKRIYTTKVVVGTEFKAVKFELSPLFNHIVRTTNDPQTDGFICDESLDT